MNTSFEDFSKVFRAFFSQALTNLDNKAKGQKQYDLTCAKYKFPVDDTVRVAFGMGMNGSPAYIPWIGFMGPDQKAINGIYPVILYYTQEKTIIVTYGISATNEPLLQWGDSIKNKDGNTPITIGQFFNSQKHKRNYDASFVYSTYPGNINDNNIVRNIYDDICAMLPTYKYVLNCIVAAPPLPPVLQKASTTKASSFNIQTIIDSIKDTGLIYPDSIIERLAYSLMAKPFVILSGLSGSGKTQLAISFAKCLCEDIKKQICIVSVGADWTNREPLLGYPNALIANDYCKPESGVLQLLIDAQNDDKRPYFIILDEMNLSVVERYFADFLSSMESKDPIKLWKGKSDVPQEIPLPKNVFIIGTINVDETTYMFSPKVLDRSSVIEFKISPEEMSSYLNNSINIQLTKAYSSCANMSEDFVKKATNQIVIKNTQDQISVLEQFFKKLKEVNAEFGYRSVNEISRYLYFAASSMKADEAMDTALLQKLLPKLHGSQKKLKPVLSEMWIQCCKSGVTIDISDPFDDKNQFKYPQTAEKIHRMYHALLDYTFTSFAEA